MLPASSGALSAVALSLLLVLAGCAGAGGPSADAGTTPNPTATAPTTAPPESPAGTPTPATTPTPPTTGVRATPGRSIPTGEIEGPPYDGVDFPLSVWIFAVHQERLRNATFTYGRDLRSAVEGSDRAFRETTRLHAGRDGRVRWTTTLYGVGRNGSVTIEDYRDGAGVQYERGPDPETEAVEYAVFNHTDDLYVETIALGPQDARFALWLGSAGRANLTYRGTEAMAGERLHVYSHANTTGNYSAEVTLWLTDRGVIRRATSRLRTPYDGGVRVRESTETYTAVNETTVEPPGWLDEARAEAG